METNTQLARRAPRVMTRRPGQTLMQITPQKLNLNLHGSFRVLHAHDTSLRCGPHGTPHTIQYDVAIGSRPDLVDERGFIIDWRDISRAVAKRYASVTHFPSCELFATEICQQVGEMLAGRCVSIEVKVGINGLPANMTAAWQAA
jgi:hypothetical protein